MGSPYGELVFAVDNNPPQGFTNTDANRDQVKDEIVIRELLQNALDSGTGTRAVRFVLDEVAASSIFGIDRYKEAFKHACRYLAEDEPPTGKQMIKRIQKALNKDSLPCLFCYDDGNGIAEAELRSLYGSGRSTKRTAGRGYVALAAVIFGNWSPYRMVMGCVLFGFSNALELANRWQIPSQLLQCLPYLLTMVVLVGVIGKSKPPASLGK